MSQKKYTRVRYKLDAQDVEDLSIDEIRAILRGADDLIMTGGRSLLTKILKGSRDKKLLGLELHNSPVYGYYNHLTLAKIQARVDWVILNGYLALEYELSIPLLRYTQRGWEIERETVAKELLQGFDEMLSNGQTEFNIIYLKDHPRDMIFILLDLVKETDNKKYIPILEAWAEIDYTEVRKYIFAVIQHLNAHEHV